MIRNIPTLLTAKRIKGRFRIKILWTGEVLERLTGIKDYISQASPERAVRFIDQLIRHAKSLAHEPRAGSDEELC